MPWMIAVVVAALTASGCQARPDRGPDAGSEAQPAVHMEAAWMAADSLVDRHILRMDSLLRGVAPLSSGEEERLRRHLQDDHLAAARRLGIEPVEDRRTAGRMMGEPSETSGVVRLRTNDSYIIDPRMGYAVPLLVPPAATVLDRIGWRFQEDLRAMGLPPYRFIVTNVLRTGIDQAHLRGTNVNAARGESTHEFGTTFDLYYARFHYVGARDYREESAARISEAALDMAGDAASEHSWVDRVGLRRQLRAKLGQAYREYGRSHADALKAVLGRALIAMQEEQQIVVTYERAQPVFHVTALGTELVVDDGAENGEGARRVHADAASRLADVDDDIEDLAEQLDAADLERKMQLTRLLQELRAARDTVRRALDGVDPLAPESERDALPGLKRSVAELEGKVEWTHLEFLDRPEAVRRRVRSRLRQVDRTLSLIDGFLENAPSEVRMQYVDDVSEVRSHYELLRRRLATMDAAGRADQAGPDFEMARAEISDGMSRLVTDLQLVFNEVQAAGF